MADKKWHRQRALKNMYSYVIVGITVSTFVRKKLAKPPVILSCLSRHFPLLFLHIQRKFDTKVSLKIYNVKEWFNERVVCGNCSQKWKILNFPAKISLYFVMLGETMKRAG
jgi:hypothetical protein